MQHVCASQGQQAGGEAAGCDLLLLRLQAVINAAVAERPMHAALTSSTEMPASPCASGPLKMVRMSF